MKLKLQHIFLTFLLAFVAPAGFYAAYAQDAASHIADSYDTHSDTDRIIYLPGGETEPSGGGNSKPPNPPKDSIATSTSQQARRVVRAPGENLKPSQVRKQSNEEDDSMLSFNFLYYIIQKYKLQDIVD